MPLTQSLGYWCCKELVMQSEGEWKGLCFIHLALCDEKWQQFISQGARSAGSGINAQKFLGSRKPRWLSGWVAPPTLWCISIIWHNTEMSEVNVPTSTPFLRRICCSLTLAITLAPTTNLWDAHTECTAHTLLKVREQFLISAALTCATPPRSQSNIPERK
jgi:hypothetical protein